MTIRTRVATRFDDMVGIARHPPRHRLGELGPTTDIDRAARQVIAHMEGLMMLAKVHRDPNLLRDLGPTITRLLT